LMADRPRWRDPILEWRLSEIERRIQQRFRIIMAESRIRRATFQPPQVSWRANEQANDGTTINDDAFNSTSRSSLRGHDAALVSELEKQIEDEIIEDRLRNSDAAEWSLSSRCIRNLRLLGMLLTNFPFSPHLTRHESNHDETVRRIVENLDPGSQEPPRNIRHTWTPHTSFIEQAIFQSDSWFDYF
jgi:hypothetical protein